MKKSFSVLILFLFIIQFNAKAQKQEISGRVIDNETKEPLAFVNVVYGNPARGTTTNIDGHFSLKIDETIDTIKISYIGYHTKKVSVSSYERSNQKEVPLQKKMYDIDEVVITPGMNPANRIMQKVWEHQEENNPKSLQSFSYRSYNKMVFTFDTTAIEQNDSDSIDTTTPDSTDMRMQKFMEKQHLFLTESVSKKKFLSPDKTSEEVLASRVSGFKDPSLVFMASQFQSFSFYDNFIQIGDYNYLNPINKNSPRKYLFQLEDTLFNEEMDTVYLISFRPRKGKNFDALKGMLHVNTNNYALQSVIAEPSDPPENLAIRIQQKYQLIDGKQWFPTQLNTRMEFTEFSKRTKKYEYSLIGDGKTYLKNIKLNPELDPDEFGHVELAIPDSAYKKNEEYWQSNRATDFTEREKRTYEIIDSIGEANNFDRNLKTFQVLSKGYIPFGFLNLDINKFLGYNQYEGWRFGAGFMTNDKLSSVFSVGGYMGYGLKDEKYKYGGKLLVSLHEASESRLDFTYTNDVIESGGYSFLGSKNMLTTTESFRDYMVKSMFHSERYESGFSFRSFEFLKTRLFVSRSLTGSFEDYTFHKEGHLYDDEFPNTEAGIQLKYAYGEKFLKTPWGKFSQGTEYPVFYANVKRGINLLGGEFNYTKAVGRLEYDFLTKTFGSTKLNVVGGLVEGDVPVFRLYNGHGSYENQFTVQVDNSFATMRLNEFYADRFISLFFKQNFGSLLFKTNNFKPRISFVTNSGWGMLSNKDAHENIALKSFSKGYYESGLLIENILSANFFSYGLGIYYRYGPYAFNKPVDNLAYKLCFRFKFGNN